MRRFANPVIGVIAIVVTVIGTMSVIILLIILNMQIPINRFDIQEFKDCKYANSLQ